MPLEQGSHLAHYEIVAPIGQGGMGEVYRAHDTKLGRDVALKVLPEEMANDEALLRGPQKAVISLPMIRLYPIFDTIRDHPRYLQLEVEFGSESPSD